MKSWANRPAHASLIAGLLVALSVPAAAKKPAETSPPADPNSFVIPAYAFDRGNSRTFTSQWADAEPMIGFGGETPLIVEYDISLPVSAEWTFSVRYSAHSSRPMEFLLDSRQVGRCCARTTGTWNTSGAQWEQLFQGMLETGKHTITLRRDGPIPHIVALRFAANVPLPKGWAPKRPTARKLNSPAPQPIVKPFTPEVDVAALRRAIEDLTASFGPRYPRGREYLDRLAALESRLDNKKTPGEELRRVKEELLQLRAEALLANPLLDFDKLLLVKRHNKGPQLGLPRNWQSNSSLAKTGYDDQIAVLSPVRPDGRLSTLYKPDGGRFVGDVDLEFDAQRMLFSMPGENNRWQVFEIRSDGTGLRQLTGEEPDVDSYDACYLPDGRILFTSTACFIGVPCVYGSSHVAVLYMMDADGRNIRQLAFDQEHDWCPTVLNNGRVLYARWEYTDTPHSNTRLLFHMNPDGTGQMEYMGSNSYWPNSFFYARPVPNHPTKVISVIGGHHDHPRMGELVVFDPAQGRFEATGAVQRIPGHGKPVEPIIRDALAAASWPKFLHPYPLSDKYFLVACKPNASALWGVYLVDVFDNLLPIKQIEEFSLFEPIPLRKTRRPPVIPDKVDLKRTDAVVYLPDIYVGDGLKGVPRGTVKKLRLVTYHFAYQGMGGLLGVIGMDGPWDIKRVLGTVPVYPDGSAKFRIPANTPISLQPLDSEGKTLQLMRSWMTAMPGEIVQCAGCHEKQNTAPPLLQSFSASRRPDEIQPWRGSLRGFNYAREVQPVIDRYCLGCHDGRPGPVGQQVPNFRGDQKITDWRMISPGNGGAHAGKFPVGYAEMCRYVRRSGIESDYHLLEPLEFHADTTHLVQLLKANHYNVRLDAESWDRLVTWIDLNCPFHGTWSEELDNPGPQRDRRRELLKKYANVDDDPEAVPTLPSPFTGEGLGVRVSTATAVVPEPIAPAEPTPVRCDRWPLPAAEAQRRQAAAGPTVRHSIDLGDGLKLPLALIPPGEFVIGAADGLPDQRPRAVVAIPRAYWMSTVEITNQIYARFDPNHDSRVEDKNTYQFGIHGYPCNRPEQPVVRVSWNEAMDFCRWLSQKTGRRFSLPTEAQWEYACRAGTETAFWYGDLNADFSKMANLADAKLSEFASNPYTVDQPLANPSKYDDWIPKDSRSNDGAVLTIEPGRYQANPWGLFDMHGNAAEWTRTAYRPYPYVSADGRDAPTAADRRVVRGGSWRDQPHRSTSAFRLSYHPWQRVHNVGFRVVCEPDPAVAAR